MRKTQYSFFSGYLILVITVMIVCSCDRKTEIFTQQEVATAWADMALHITKTTPANSPTFASRGFGYIGLTMYESIVHGYPTHRTMAGQLL